LVVRAYVSFFVSACVQFNESTTMLEFCSRALGGEISWGATDEPSKNGQLCYPHDLNRPEISGCMWGNRRAF